MKSDKLFVEFVLDRSGSMSSLQNSVVNSINEYVTQLRLDNEPKNVRFSLLKFDSQSMDYVFDQEKLTDVREMTSADFDPRGMTPLYDAIGRAFRHIKENKKKKENVAIVILTDGQENCSREFTSDSIKSLMQQAKNDGWLIIYLGANQDAITEGNKFGQAKGLAMSYNTAKLGDTVAMAAMKTREYREVLTSGGVAEDVIEFTDHQRGAVS